ncbi:uncharacterized protein EMH_0020460 [Eimeria mitis]|uniref:Uncharacterized protein n=1 Tax=Eimeria mitis TaxID=44415 RepID=U6JV07_9EIME|nr:uncharacterized protein EMH_0020460 [Eimeria mitis]CDJ29310.1 hypothetical protein, conserved [Eimeria mitis]
MAFGASGTTLCGARHTQRLKNLNFSVRFLLIAALIAVPVAVSNSEEIFDVVAEPTAEPEVMGTELAETEARVEMRPPAIKQAKPLPVAPAVPEVSPEQEQPDAAPLEEASRERSSLAAVYNASTAQQSPSEEANGAQAGVLKRRAQLIGLAILLSLGIFLLRAKVRLS